MARREDRKPKMDQGSDGGDLRMHVYIWASGSCDTYAVILSAKWACLEIAVINSRVYSVLLLLIKPKDIHFFYILLLSEHRWQQ